VRLRVRAAVAVGAVLATLAVPAARAGDNPVGCGWAMYGHDAGRSFALPPGCSSVTPASAPTLLPNWAHPTPDAVSASPTIVDGRLYIGDWAGNFYRFDAATGNVDWTFRVDDPSAVGFGRIVSTAAYTEVDGRALVIFGGGATLYALDASTGEEVARVCVDPRADPAVRCRVKGPQVEIESSPAVVQDALGTTSVVVGMDVHNEENVGRTGVMKFALTGDSLTPLWKFDPEAVESYTGPDLLTRNAGDGSSGCAGVWGSPAVDVQGDRVVFGTASCLNQAADGVGEHLWGVSLATGELLWSFGPHTGDTARYDDDFGASPNLLPNGLVGCGSKDGWYYAVDRATGALAWKTYVGQPGHVSPGFAVGGFIGSPATGTVNGEPAIFAATAISTPNDLPLESPGRNVDQSLVQDPGRMFSLHAIRASDGAILWRAPTSRQAYGAPTFVNGVVLVPSTFDFQLKAFNANTGLLLAARPLGGPPASAPTAMGDSVYLGAGTSTSAGSPLAPLSGVYAFRLGRP
jgi:polyvinyl alcohol dehydrogenase (cytochrome)